MKKIILSTLLLVFAIGFTACEKIEKDIPANIKKLIKATNKKSECLGRVIEYDYDNEHIYCFENHPNCFDGSTIYYNEKGNKLWEIGDWIVDTSFENFYEKAIFKKIIWKAKDWYDIKNE